jgi:hypothetical protein
MENKKMIIERFFEKLTFEEEAHKYYVDGQQLYTSVSGIIKNYVKDVDYKKISHSIDRKLRLPIGATKQRWDNKATLACALGNRAHYFGELYAFHRNIEPIDEFEEAAKKFWDELPDHIVPVFTELQMYHFTNMFGGTADIILYNLRTGKFIIADYKTNEDIFKNFKSKKLLAPFDNLLESAFNKYQIQFSLYQIQFEQTGFEVEKRVLVWLKPNGTYLTYETEDLTEILIKELEK